MAKTSKTLLILGTLFTLVSCSAKRWLSVTTEVFQSSYEESKPTIEEKTKTIIARYESSYERKNTKESVFETADMSSYVSDVDYVNCRVRMQCHSYGYTKNLATGETTTYEKDYLFYFGYFDGLGVATLTNQTGENKYYVIYQDYMVQNKAKELGSLEEAIRVYFRGSECNWLASYSMSDTFVFPLQYFDIDGYYTPSQYTIDKQCELSGAGDFRFSGKRVYSSSEGELIDTTYMNIEFNDYLFVHGYYLFETADGYMEKKDVRQRGRFQFFEMPDIKDYEKA